MSAGFFNGSDWRNAPKRARWQIHCDDCNPHAIPDDMGGGLCGGCYWISLDRIKTPVALVERCAHLAEKGWISSTDWANFLRKAVEVGS